MMFIDFIDDDGILVQQVQRDRNTWNTIQDPNFSFFSWTMNNKKQRIEREQKSKKNEWRSNNEQNKLTTTINEQQ
jgi:hypothetical protein